MTTPSSGSETSAGVAATVTPTVMNTTTPTHSILAAASNLIKLTRTNFRLWRGTILPFLKGNDLYKYVDGSFTCTETNADGTVNPEYSKWHNQDQLGDYQGRGRNQNYNGVGRSSYSSSFSRGQSFNRGRGSTRGRNGRSSYSGRGTSTLFNGQLDTNHNVRFVLNTDIWQLIALTVLIKLTRPPPTSMTVNATTNFSPSEWLPDTAASHHFTGDFSWLNLSSSDYTGTDMISLGDGSTLPITYQGNGLLPTPTGSINQEGSTSRTR